MKGLCCAIALLRCFQFRVPILPESLRHIMTILEAIEVGCAKSCECLGAVVAVAVRKCIGRRQIGRNTRLQHKGLRVKCGCCVYCQEMGRNAPMAHNTRVRRKQLRVVRNDCGGGCREMH